MSVEILDLKLPKEISNDTRPVSEASTEPYAPPMDSTAELQPEFINIKMEVNEEPSEECGETHPADETRQTRGFHVTVKQEPLDPAEDPHQFEYESNHDNTMIVQPDIAQYIHNGPDLRESPTDKPQSDLTCKLCLKLFSSRSNLVRHQIVHSREKAECPLCKRQFSNQAVLEKHVSGVHFKQKVFDCDECNKSFRSVSNLYQHQRIHLTVKPYTCDICDKTFAIKANMVKHRGKSRCKKPRTEPLKCNVCNKVFEKEFLLKSHLRMHTTEKPFECADCGMAFKYKSTLIRHLQIHNNDRPYSCNVCLKTFTHSGLLKPHMRKHTGERPYSCPICQKKFSHKHNMQRHTLRHNKIKHLVCEICHKKFPKESRLKYHMRMHMEDKRPFKCEFCAKCYSHRQNIQRHYKKKHPNHSYDRPETDASFASIYWQSVLKKKSDTEKEYIIPEAEHPDDGFVKIKEEWVCEERIKEEQEE